jgi:hypothetical protein
MHLTTEHLELAAAAHFASLDGKGIVITDDAYVVAHDLAEHGWLQRRFQPDGELSWHWTPQADTALGLSNLLDVQGRDN